MFHYPSFLKKALKNHLSNISPVEAKIQSYQ